MIDCNQAVRQLWGFLEGELDDKDRHAVEEHLDLCKRCCGEAEFASELRKMLHSQSAPDLSDDAKVRLTNFLEQM
ncbi:MAG: zf-HC2 domain-containing protein [Actinomycetota bacterium]